MASQVFTVDTETGLLEVENFLASNAYLSGGPLPGKQDAEILGKLKTAPSDQKYPNLFSWWFVLSMFTPQVRETWGATAAKAPAVAPKQEEAKKAEDDFELFGDEPEKTPEQLAKEAEENEKKKAAAKAKAKKEVIAKSIVIFDVKVLLLISPHINSLFLLVFITKDL